MSESPAAEKTGTLLSFFKVSAIDVGYRGIRPNVQVTSFQAQRFVFPPFLTYIRLISRHHEHYSIQEVS